MQKLLEIHTSDFPKILIKGPEDLMEKILTKYGQYTFLWCACND
jgi:hypothetical protein